MLDVTRLRAVAGRFLGIGEGCSAADADTWLVTLTCQSFVGVITDTGTEANDAPCSTVGERFATCYTGSGLASRANSRSCSGRFVRRTASSTGVRRVDVREGRATKRLRVRLLKLGLYLPVTRWAKRNEVLQDIRLAVVGPEAERPDVMNGEVSTVMTAPLTSIAVTCAGGTALRRPVLPAVLKVSPAPCGIRCANQSCHTYDYTKSLVF